MVTLAQILRNYLGNRQTCHSFGRVSSDFVIEDPNSRIAPRVALGSPVICVMKGAKVLSVLNEKGDLLWTLKESCK